MPDSTALHDKETRDDADYRERASNRNPKIYKFGIFEKIARFQEQFMRCGQ